MLVADGVFAAGLCCFALGLFLIFALLLGNLSLLALEFAFYAALVFELGFLLAEFAGQSAVLD